MERRILILIWLPLTFGWFLLQQLLRARNRNMYLNLPMQRNSRWQLFFLIKDSVLRLIRREILLWDTDVFLYSVVAVGRQSYAGIPVISGLPSIIWVLIFMDVIWHTEVCSCLLLLRGVQ